jgi:hypothetical protein
LIHKNKVRAFLIIHNWKVFFKDSLEWFGRANYMTAPLIAKNADNWIEGFEFFLRLYR